MSLRYFVYDHVQGSVGGLGEVRACNRDIPGMPNRGAPTADFRVPIAPVGEDRAEAV